jgi:hypothetical protein
MKNRKNSLGSILVYWAPRWRSGLIRFLERVLSGSNISDRLGGDLSQIQHLGEVRAQIIEIQVVSDPFFSKKFEIDGVPTQGASLQRKVGLLKDCNVHVRTGLIRLKSGFILDGAFPHWQQLLYQGGYVHEYRTLRNSKKYLPGTYLAIPTAKYFYHFIIEDLPNISWALEFYPECKVLLSVKSPTWQLNVLEDLNIKYELTSVQSSTIERLVFVTAPRMLTSPDIERIQGFRIAPHSTNEDLRIYVARGQKDRGNSKLETELIKFLQSKGYKVIYPDDIAFSEQRMFFETSSRIISFHGGALTNLVWCRPQTRVLEIFNHSFRTYDYAKICAETQLNYFHLNFNNFEWGPDLAAKLVELIPEEFLTNHE